LIEYSGIIYKMPSIEDIRQKLKAQEEQRLQYTNAVRCNCGNLVSLEDEDSVIARVGYRKYADGRGNLPKECNERTDCEAKRLLE